ncbi:probable NADH dehydrogenase [ubiquinone] 1 alpha subcomplex subunit 12 [Fopius arisanus]|uniref:NADH dehydrogenase [ubiquinone] 1 alpha subcomplex subunit 12 n=1 Tax=Fopius arisanus TaxID=64838 RepID=A0A9R1U2U9_9HYME|nr:PREDICTED: probable NADH dehydrogenase [ubiquinone] 1 alpha subcomplex subunit 12 [Fopius arisanus]
MSFLKAYLNIFGNFGKVIKQNGGPIGCLKTLYRMDDLKWGTLVGEDKYGNKYYENNYYFYGRNRWIVYAPYVHMNYDGSQVPAEWFGWLHYKTDLLPQNDPSRPKHKWMIDHQMNLSGTNQAYMPYSTTKSKVEPWKPPQC